MSEATLFHRSLPGYEPSPLRDLPWLAAETGSRGAHEDESNRFGLPRCSGGAAGYRVWQVAH